MNTSRGTDHLEVLSGNAMKGSLRFSQVLRVDAVVAGSP